MRHTPEIVFVYDESLNGVPASMRFCGELNVALRAMEEKIWKGVIQAPSPGGVHHHFPRTS